MNSIAEIIEDLRQGKMVVLLDNEDRENEGDLIMSAQHITPEAVNFMARFGRGLICMPMSPKRCQQLKLSLMVENNQSPYSTNFTVSIEAASGVTTGISAADRARTIQMAAANEASPGDIISPGHIFPLLAKPGGVLTRAGHTEAVVDLVQLAGCGDAGVLVEILNEDGTMARREDCARFAAEHNLKIGTIEALIHYRLSNEQTVKPVTEKIVDTKYGCMKLCAFQDDIEHAIHFALVKGDIREDTPTLVRVHTLDMFADLFGLINNGTSQVSWTFSEAMKHIADHESGVLLLLAKQPSSLELLQRLQESQQTRQVDYRYVGVGSQILKCLGVRKMRLMTHANHFYALSGFDLEVVEIVSHS